VAGNEEEILHKGSNLGAFLDQKKEEDPPLIEGIPTQQAVVSGGSSHLKKRGDQVPRFLSGVSTGRTGVYIFRERTLFERQRIWHFGAVPAEADIGSSGGRRKVVEWERRRC